MADTRVIDKSLTIGFRGDPLTKVPKTLLAFQRPDKYSTVSAYRNSRCRKIYALVVPYIRTSGLV